MKQVPHTFFDRNAVKVARDLLGCFLVRKRGRSVKRYMITETEAYEGLEDKASHASRGRTKRNEIMFMSAGHIYAYFTYGMHWMLNIVTGPKNHPAAVLIRGVQDVDSKQKVGKKILLDGPAKLTKKLDITGMLNKKTLSKKTGLWVERGAIEIKECHIERTARIGVDYAGPKWSKKKWRFVYDWTKLL